MTPLASVVVIGLGATLCIDLWSLFLRLVFDIRSLDYCLLGRWVLHLPAGRVRHERIEASPAKAWECPAGWAAHYSIGVAFAWLFVWLAPDGWLQRPTFLPALAFGVATVVVPFFTVQPAFGLGIAASHTARPSAARLKSVATHVVYGLGLYACAWALTA